MNKSMRDPQDLSRRASDLLGFKEDEKESYTDMVDLRNSSNLSLMKWGLLFLFAFLIYTLLFS